MNRMMLIVIAIIVLLAVTFALGRYSASKHSDAMATSTESSSTPAQKPLYWYDPMYPQQHFDQPGKSPFMDMELVAKYADDTSSNGAAVRIDSQMVQNLAIRYATATRQMLAAELTAAATLQFNERDVAIAQTRVGGFVTSVAALAPGDRVKRDQILLQFRAPEWSAAIEEWLLLQVNSDFELRDLSTQRLTQLGLNDDDLKSAKKLHMAPQQFFIRAPQSGVIDTLDVRAGMTLMAGQTVARIVADDPLWLELAVPQQSAAWLRRDLRAEVRFTAFESRVFNGRVKQILSAVDQASGTLRVRIELPNHDGKLRAGLVAQVRLQGEPRDSLTVATDAIIRSGKRNLLIVADDEKNFRPQMVELGSEVGDVSEIISGIDEGQRVVRSGQFLIDSEASLSGVLARMTTTENTSAELVLHEADGVVDAIDGDSITLSHGPFESLGMMGMTMTFPLLNHDVIRNIAVGDKVRIAIKSDDNGMVVMRLRKMEHQHD